MYPRLHYSLIFILVSISTKVYASNPIKDVMWTFRSHAYNLSLILKGDRKYDQSQIDNTLIIYKDGAMKLKDNLPDNEPVYEDLKKRFGDLIQSIDKNKQQITDLPTFQMHYRKITILCNSCHDKYDN